MKNEIQKVIRAQLLASSEPRFAQFSLALIPGLSQPMLGVRLPILRKMAKRMAVDYGEALLQEDWNAQSFEESMLHGLYLGYLKTSWTCRWQEIRKFVPVIDNWSVCDSSCATYKEVREHREEVWPDLLGDLHSELEFVQRFAVVMLIDHFLVDAYIDRVLQAWEQVSPAGYYVEMAIGWGLSVAILLYPEQTLRVIEGTKLPWACRQKACQKILESRRTPLHIRQRISALRACL